MNTKGSQTLFHASLECKLRLVRMLVEGGTSVDSQNERLETPLILCCQSQTDVEDKSRVVSYLLTKNAKVNLQDSNGRTALIHACLANSGTKIIKTLLDFKSNPWIEDKSNNTVFDYAINAEDLETTRLLINSCRETKMFPDAHDNFEIKHLAECLANIKDMRKFSWPLMGSSLRSNHTHVHGRVTEKEDAVSLAVSDMLRTKLGEGSSSPKSVRRRKRSVCQFDPLDLQAILHCNDEITTSTSEELDEYGEMKSIERQKKSSLRSLSEEERFSFQLSDSENTPPGSSAGLEKLLRLQDSFSSSVDSNEVPYFRQSSISKPPDSPSDQECTAECTDIITEVINGEKKDVLGERQGETTNEDADGCDRVFGAQLIKAKENSSDFNISDKTSENPKDDNIVSMMVCTTEVRSSSYTSSVMNYQSAPGMSPLDFQHGSRRRTFSSATLKQHVGPRGSPSPNSETNNRREKSIRRYTLSSLEGRLLHNTETRQKLLTPPPKDSMATDPDRSSPEYACAPTDNSVSPPGLRKTKSDLTEWRSMARNLQGKEQRSNIQVYQQTTEHALETASEDQSSQLQLPTISSAKKGRHSPYLIPVIHHSDDIQTEEDLRVDLTHPWRNNADKPRSPQTERKFSFDDQKLNSQNPRRVSLPCSSIDIRIPSPRNAFDSCDVVAIATTTDVSARGWDVVPRDVLPDLLSHYSTQFPEELSPRHTAPRPVISPFNFDHRPAKESLPCTSKGPEERSGVASTSQQRISPRLRPGTLLPPLTILQRRSPTHEMEDGYFSCSPSPADTESPRRKSSSEQLRYTFRPISPRSPIRSPKPFSLQPGKLPSSR